MSFTRCNYADCSEIRKRSAFRFYTFPVNDKHRCDMWIQASGNRKLLEVEKHQLQNMCLCERHFEEHAFINKTHHRLNKSAVPKHFSQPTADVQMTAGNQNVDLALDSSIVGKYLFHIYACISLAAYNYFNINVAKILLFTVQIN